MNAIEFGQFIAQQRKAIGLTQKELAERLLVTDKVVSRWENGHGYPDIETLENLSNALEVSLVELMHSKKNESDTITIQEASEYISSTISINAAARRSERRITLIVFIMSLLFVILLIDSAKHRRRKYIFLLLCLALSRLQYYFS